MVDLNVLHKLGLNIIDNTKRINEIWKNLSLINNSYPLALDFYGQYLSEIKNDSHEADEYIKKGKQMKQKEDHVNDFEVMFAQNTAIVVISGNKDTASKIMKTNNGISILFGYNMFEVHGHEVNILMPPIIGQKHNFFLDHYFKTAKEKHINKNIETYAMLRTSHIFSITLIVKPVPSLKNDIQYIGMMKPTFVDYDFILTDHHGKIDSVSNRVTGIFGIS
jgi:hypothetical protein